MRTRSLSLVATLALVLAACGGSVSDETTSTSADQAATTSTTAEAESATPDAELLSYNLEAGTSYEYEVSLDQSIEMSVEGDPAAMEDEEIPGQMSVNFKGTTTLMHSVAEGPEPDTFEITITGDFTDLEISGTIDGEPIDQAELPDFATMEPIEQSIVVDGQGRPIGEDSEAFGDLFGGDLGGFGDLGDLGGFGGSGFEFSHVGPQFPDEPVTVGDTWTDTIEVPMDIMGDADPITTEITSEVTGTDSIDGSEVLVIDTRSITSAIEFDLAEFLIGFLMAFAPEGSEGDVDLETLAQELRFMFSIDESVNDLTTWFDPETGYARRAEYSGGTHLVMDINMPDEESGEMAGFVMDMTVEQAVGYRLLSAGSPEA